jgi:hypothetical protein
VPPREQRGKGNINQKIVDAFGSSESLAKGPKSCLLTVNDSAFIVVSVAMVVSHVCLTPSRLTTGSSSRSLQRALSSTNWSHE